MAVARSVSPYLERLCQRRADAFQGFVHGSLCDGFLNAFAHAAAADQLGLHEAMAALRQAKADTHLGCALGDLSGELGLQDVTHYLSSLADIATCSAMGLACRTAQSRDKALMGGQALVPGLFILAMGKHGAGELNYSSDIDLAAFYDRDAFEEEARDNASGLCVRHVQAVSRILEEVTPDGYVFRVDWRLRPDPASTPVAVSLRAAEAYYESVGQNWERAAFIKARAIGGDLTIAASFLDHLRPFIWRKNLDFAAIDDVQSILRQIHAVHRSKDSDDPAFDVKLGRGGIREIEFFAQTQQLILGGRDASLRLRGTLDALDALVDAGRIDAPARDDLAHGYRFLRAIEHRIQMLDDEQTHQLPSDPSRRARVAVLSGHENLAALDRDIRACRDMVRTRVRELFPESKPLSSPLGSLVFTGVEDDLETLETIASLGFSEPSSIAKTIRAWHHGHIPATRTARARELLTALTPELLQAIAATGEPEIGFARFQDFFAALPAGVQILSLFKAEPKILKETCATLALAPRLGTVLAQRPAILDAMLSPHFLAPLAPDTSEIDHNIMADMVIHPDQFEHSLDIVRRCHREELFRIGFQVLHGRARADQAGRAYSKLAEATIQSLIPVATESLVPIHGRIHGRFAVCAWGKLGGQELAADSDLDLMIVYDVDDELQESDGERPISAEQWHTRFTQRLVSALSVQTAEGSLYDVDMQLRPSGRAGPVAVQFSALKHYYRDQAWTWELQALTRLRPVAGDLELISEIMDMKAQVLSVPRELGTIRADIVAMRKKMALAHPVRGRWDIKRQSGGLIDLEFLSQYYQLLGASRGHNCVRANTIEALHALAEFGVLAFETAGRLILAGRVLHDVRQILAVAAGPNFDADRAGSGLKRAIARCLDAPDFTTVQAKLDDAQTLIREQFMQFAV
ncbi:bifunctional [glutamine synthetase] adenylyltransferase/[glutamine synthetase]-adenylyl-L-tyrosine phosphorylase [Candidatus Phycosocius spiralis]|nr:bifunctional [glutamine synthetase] adenylyltransferase/[glutamine synthetase]-adenylyl-L-tyrosine phosphorylase [Candidatus Phycosocius spiralis]